VNGGTPLAGEGISYGPDGPTERELRLVGDPAGRRVLELGCGGGQAAVALARQGAMVIAVDGSADELRRARESAERDEVKVEWRQGDLADLAFLRAESMDVVLSVGAVTAVDDVPRLFRQVQRVLKPGAPFVFSHEHPLAHVLDAVRTSPAPLGIGDIFTELGRAGFRVDTIVETRPPAARVPTTVVWRARKEGA